MSCPRLPGGATVAVPASREADFVEILRRLAERCDLSRQEATWALDRIVDRTVGEIQASAFVMGLRVKGETAEEIAGLADSMLRSAVRVETPDPRSLVDIVGTGGDALGTFNISTCASLVVAAAGVKVAKHGNRAASSRCGSADVLEALGVKVDLGPREVAASIDRVGIGFMLAALYHPALGNLAMLRKTLGVRTVFNFLGPLVNPAGAGIQLMGVSSADHLEVLAGALARMGCERGFVVHGEGGMDELSVTGPSTVIEVAAGQVRERYVVEPQTCGVAVHELEALSGGGPAENASITRKVLAGVRGGPRDAVLVNAGAALYIAGRAPSIKEGVDVARACIDSGRAARILETLVDFTNKPLLERP